ncbi:hypothetical protein, partial [Deinococcus sp.]|uniref:hypothetical protein n=1 Tax=Deinococcus sp. TaxID=47478 RepID=UPI00391A2783
MTMTGQSDRAGRAEHHPGVLQIRETDRAFRGEVNNSTLMSTAMRKQGIKHIDTAPLAERYGTIL